MNRARGTPSDSEPPPPVAAGSAPGAGSVAGSAAAAESVGTAVTRAIDARALAPGPRFVRVFGAWMLLTLATPGLLFPEGSAVLATLALVPWALGASRSGKKAFWIEWLAAGIGLSAACFWTTHVLWITLLVVAIVPAFYMAVAGVVLRRLAGPFPLWIAVPAAWVGLETLRYAVEPPFGFGWMRLGHHASHVEWLAGSARLFGVGGLSFVLAAVAGGLAHGFVGGLARRRGADRAQPATGGVSLAREPGRAARAVFALAPALGPLALAAGAGLATSAPPSGPGPRVLLVQPAFEQARKMHPPDPRELLDESIALTRRGLDELARRGARAPDLVAWGEAMLPFSLADRGLAEAHARGARVPPWAPFDLGQREIAVLDGNEEFAVRGGLFGGGGRPRVLPPGTAFLSGSDFFAVDDGVIRRWNAVLAWNAAGERIGWVSKAHLVPGGETMCGLERLAIVRELAFELAGYIPDLASQDEPRVLVLPRPGGDRSPGGDWRIGVSVCFDNAYEDVYTRPLEVSATGAAGGLDFHLVCSNEAWYLDSFEYDQMLAFSRLAAIATGRAFVRATNAGISCVISPEGRELARLTVGGRDRMVGGTLVADVPVPVDRTQRTPFVRLARIWTGLWIGLPACLMLLGSLRRRSAAP